MAYILLIAAVLMFVAAAGYLAWHQDALILPARVNPVDAPNPALRAEYTSLTTPDGNTLHGVLFRPQPAPGAAEGTPAVDELVLAFPGNTHNPIGFATFLKEEVYPTAPRVALAAFSYRGYPNGHTPPSTGTPSQAAMYADALLIYDALTEQLRPQSVKVVAYSLGTAVAVHLARNRTLDRLVLVAPLASIRRLAQEKYPWLPVRLLLRHPFAVEDELAHLTVPTTILYSPTDETIPARHVTQVLQRKNPAIPAIAVPNTNHQTLVLAPQLPNLLRKALTP